MLGVGLGPPTRACLQALHLGADRGQTPQLVEHGDAEPGGRCVVGRARERQVPAVRGQQVLAPPAVVIEALVCVAEGKVDAPGARGDGARQVFVQVVRLVAGAVVRGELRKGHEHEVGEEGEADEQRGEEAQQEDGVPAGGGLGERRHGRM